GRHECTRGVSQPAPPRCLGRLKTVAWLSRFGGPVRSTEPPSLVAMLGFRSPRRQRKPSPGFVASVGPCEALCLPRSSPCSVFARRGGSVSAQHAMSRHGAAHLARTGACPRSRPPSGRT